jgi:ubiquinone/menaquinone biosynthesis C-methylase UbiE
MASERVTDYYNQTAERYDELHGEDQNPEHLKALEKAWPILERLNPHSALDVGCGTGRSLGWLQEKNLDLVGVDPSSQVLEIARKRVPKARLEVGTGECLPMESESIDLVFATGIMHHVDSPKNTIHEMFRVAKKAVIISDHNNFAFGGSQARRLRLLLHSLGLLGIATFIKQGFKKQGYSDDDGWWYPYSLLNDYGLISSLARDVWLIPTRSSSLRQGNLLVAQSHLAIVAFKANCREV